MPLQLKLPEASQAFELEERQGTLLIRIGDHTHEVIVLDDSTPALVLVDGRPLQLARSGSRVFDGGLSAEVLEHTGAPPALLDHREVLELRAPMPGRVVALACAVGDGVVAGAPLVVLEAMKMENEVRSPRAGVIDAILVQPGQSIEASALLIRFRGEP